MGCACALSCPGDVLFMEQLIGDVPVQATDAPAQALDAEQHQAPATTDEAVIQGASEQSQEQQPTHEQVPEPQPQEQQPQVSFEEFQRIQEELQQKQTLLQQIEEMAERQRKQEEEREYRNNLRSRIQNDVVKRLQNMDSDDDITGVIDEFVGNVLQEANTTYQNQVNEYYKQVDQALWAATKTGFADSLIAEHGLPPAIKANLLAFNDHASMELAATQMKDALKSVQQQAMQQQVQQQVQQIRESGSHVVGGVQGGAPPVPEIKPGTARELTPALRHIFGLR